MTPSMGDRFHPGRPQRKVPMITPLARTARAASLALIAVAAALAGLSALAQAQGTWHRIGDPPNPPPFSGHVAAYDSTQDRVLVYQPYAYWAGVPQAAADLWEFRLGSPELGWRKLATSGPA